MTDLHRAHELDNPLDNPAPDAPDAALAHHAPDNDVVLEGQFEAPPEAPTTALARIPLPSLPEEPPAPPAPPAQPPAAPPEEPPANDNNPAPLAGSGPLGGHELRTALHYVLAACSKKDDEAALHLSTDTLGRLVLGASDGYRTHVAFVELPKGLVFPPLSVSAESARVVAGALDFAFKHGMYSTVKIESPLLWHLAYGAAEDMALEWTPAAIQAPDWRPPTFLAPPSSAHHHEAKLVSQALTLKGAKGARVARNEVDARGLRHITLTSEYGVELARAALCSVGQHEARGEDPRQERIPGTAPAPLSEKAPAQAAPEGAPTAPPSVPAGAKEKPPKGKRGPKKKAPASGEKPRRRRAKPTPAVEDPSDTRPRRVSVAAEHFEAHRRGFAAGTAMPLRKQWKKDGDVYLVTLAPGPTLDTIVGYAKERGIALTVEVDGG